MYKMGIVFFLLIQNVFSSDFVLGKPKLSGSGCHKGEASSVLSPDGRALSILFDHFSVETKGKKKVERLECEIVIPIQIPKRMQVAVYQVDTRGFTSVKSGGNTEVKIEHSFFGGEVKGKTKKEFNQETEEDFIVSNTIGIKEKVWSECGGDSKLKLTTKISAQSKNEDTSMISIDSQDVAGVTYQIQARGCRDRD